MKVTKLNAILVLVYCIVNVVLIFKLDNHCKDLQIQVDEQEKHLDAVSELTLAHLKIHDIERLKENIGSSNRGIVPMFPKIILE
tara:strand:- start:232 stop:483 length:252 start_codon:yes stop_codon:yes gene_type:complete